MCNVLSFVLSKVCFLYCFMLCLNGIYVEFMLVVSNFVLINVLFRTFMYPPVLSCTVLYCPVLFCFVLYCPTLSCTVCSVLYCPALSCTVLDVVSIIQDSFDTAEDGVVFQLSFPDGWAIVGDKDQLCFSLSDGFKG